MDLSFNRNTDDNEHSDSDENDRDTTYRHKKFTYRSPPDYGLDLTVGQSQPVETWRPKYSQPVFEKTNRLLAIMIDILSLELLEILYHHLGSSPHQGPMLTLSQWPTCHGSVMYHRMLGLLDLLINSSPIHFQGRHLPKGQQVLDMISVSIINFNIRSHQRREELTLPLL